MRRMLLYLLIIAAGYFGIAEWWEYRVHMASVTALQYAPRAVVRTVIPAGTKIRTVLKDGVTESARPGDRIVGFVSYPVMANNRVVIPIGTPINGILRQISRDDKEARISLNFTSVVIGRHEVPVQMEPVRTSVPIESDIEVLGSALDAVGEAGIGVALGSRAQSDEGVAAGLTLGAMNSSGLTLESTEITLVLSRPLELHV